MAKKTFSIAEYIKPEDVSKLDHPADATTVVMLPIGEIAENELNFYDTSELGKLADSIALNGLLEPIIVIPIAGDDRKKYKIISGHRRFKAFTALRSYENAENKSSEKYAMIPAIVREPPQNEIIEELLLIEGNRATRVLSSADTLKQAERYKDLLVSLKAQGVEIPGRLRDVVAEAMDISASRLARLEVIRKGLISEYAEAFKTNEINESTAYELARLAPFHQQQLYEHIDVTDYAAGQITELDKRMEIFFGPALKCDRNRDARTQAPGYCDHGAEMWAVSKKKNIWNMCDGCCADCYNRRTCKSVCHRVAPDVEKEKAEIKAKDGEAITRRKQMEAARDNYIATFWSREKTARETAGITPEDAFSKLDAMCASLNTCPVLDDYKDLMQQENGCPNDPEDADASYWRDVDDPCDFDVITVFADLYGCSVDYLIGRSDKLGSDTAKTAPEAAKGKSGDGLRWRSFIDEPPAEGQCFVLFEFKSFDPDEAPYGNFDIRYYHNGKCCITGPNQYMPDFEQPDESAKWLPCDDPYKDQSDDV